MHFTLERLGLWRRRTQSKTLVRIRGRRRRYIWQTVWVVVFVLAACALGIVSGIYYTD
jgi:hypothetical protein